MYNIFFYFIRKISENQEIPDETSSIKKCIENTVITIIDSDSNDSELKNTVSKIIYIILKKLLIQSSIVMSKVCLFLLYHVLK